MSPSSMEDLRSWLAVRLDAYQRYGHMVATQAAAWVEDDVDEVRRLDESKEQLLAWLRIDEPAVDLDRAVSANPELAPLLEETRAELARVAELEQAYQRALEGILVDTRAELAEVAASPGGTEGYGTSAALTGSALDLTL